MNAPRIPPSRQLVSSVRSLGHSIIARARLRLGLLAFAQAFGPFAITIKLVLAAVLLGLFSAFGALVHLALALISALLMAASFVWSWQRWHSVNDAQARRAVERASALPHRPLTALADAPVLAPRLWQAHIDGLTKQVSSVRLRLPRFTLAQLDARPIRLGAWAVLLLALLLGWDEAPRRLNEAVHPPVARLLPQPVLDAWITPPAYTNQPPFSLRAEMSEVSIPEGSSLQLRVTGGWFPPVALLDDVAIRLTAEPASHEQAAGYVLNMPLSHGGVLYLRQDGAILGRWVFTLLGDAPPSIAFARPPSQTDEQALRLDYTAIDDLGLTQIDALIEPGTIAADSAPPAPLVLSMPLRKPPPKDTHGFRFFDLTAHPWAGSDVLITLRATDVKGQQTETDPLSFKLPERIFTNSIAKALIKLRRDLVVRGMGARQDVMIALNQLAGEAEDNSEGDWVGPLSLRSMVSRLRYNDDSTIMPGLIQQMWDTALHFEDGGAQQKLAELRIIQQELEDALNNNASDAEIQQLMQQLQQALQQYLDQMAQQQNQSGEMGLPKLGDVLSREDLQKFLEQLQQHAQSGQRDQARDMLSQLQQLMENLRQPGMGDPRDQQALRDLQDIMRQQQQMAERTQRFQTPPPVQQMPTDPQPNRGQSQQQAQQQSQQQESGQGQPGQSSPGQSPQAQPGQGQSSPGQSSQEQNSPGQNPQGQNSQHQSGQQPGAEGLPSPGEQNNLRDRLGQILKELRERGYQSGPFGQAQEEMGQSGEQLGKPDAQQSLKHQLEALRQMQQGMSEAARQMILRQQQEQRGNTDPLGRQDSNNGGRDTRDIEVPDQSESDRARDVLDELRRRAGDMRRSQDERDYYERLLKWF